ncbi:hypothetical protein SAMN05421882_101943 [Nitrosomonas communis]|uniref:Uncharacterized protein n=1 Tax=Nitrosomonas communis TaxID=44574 RepID=A0A1H2V4Z3_9PROT|nr:hypothetical protein SAMN05421882_101943 [Nitrosomonas communis]
MGVLATDRVPPAEKSICIIIAFEQSHRQKIFADQRFDHIDAASGMPITHTVTPLVIWRIPMRSWYIVSKTTLVNIDDSAVLSFIQLNRLLKGVPFAFAHFGMLQVFFIADVHTPQRVTYTFFAYTRPASPFGLIGTRTRLHITGQRDHVNLRRRFLTGLLEIGILHPASHAGDFHTKTRRCLRNGKSPFLSNGQKFAAK